MAVCQTCKAENTDTAKWCRECGMALPAAPPPQTPVPVVRAAVIDAVSPPAPPPIPLALRGKVEQLMNRNIGEDESADEVLTELTARAEVWAAQAGALESGPLRAQLEQTLQRPVPAGEPVHSVLQELVGKVRSAFETRDAATAALARDRANALAVPAPQIPIGNKPQSPEEAAKAATQSELHAEVENVLARKIQPGEQAPEILAELAAKLQPVVNSAIGVQFPSILSKVLGMVPKDFQWLVALLVPLLMGGGSMLMIPSSYKQQYLETQSKLKQAQDKQSQLIADSASKPAEIPDLSKDNDKIRDLNAQIIALGGQLEQSNQKTAELKNELVAARGTASSVRPFADRGFVRWQGDGGGSLQFLPDPNRPNNQKAGNIVEGKFPDTFAGRHCIIVEVVGDVNKPEALRDKPCSQPIQINGKPNDRRPKQALLVWRQGPGN
jgi:hypothetical protein